MNFTTKRHRRKCFNNAKDSKHDHYRKVTTPSWTRFMSFLYNSLAYNTRHCKWFALVLLMTIVTKFYTPHHSHAPKSQNDLNFGSDQVTFATHAAPRCQDVVPLHHDNVFPCLWHQRVNKNDEFESSMSANYYRSRLSAHATILSPSSPWSNITKCVKSFIANAPDGTHSSNASSPTVHFITSTQKLDVTATLDTKSLQFMGDTGANCFVVKKTSALHHLLATHDSVDVTGGGQAKVTHKGTLYVLLKNEVGHLIVRIDDVPCLP